MPDNITPSSAHRVEGSSLSDCPFYNWPDRDPDTDECPPDWAQFDCWGAIISTSGLCEGHHNEQPSISSIPSYGERPSGGFW